MVAKREPKTTFDRLLTRLLEGMVVPFIGAGVSYEAKHRGGITGLTKTNKMQNRVFEALKEKCASQKCCKSCVVKKEVCNEESRDRHNISFDKVCELWEWSCSENHQIETCRRFELIYDILKIPEFANVEPTDAHYYIAFLAREGLIDEVITTNYDTCMEQAYCNTFGLKYPLTGDDSPALVIDTLSEYRDKAGRKFTSGPKPRRCLKVYKINGCAGKLIIHRDAASYLPQRILWSEDKKISTAIQIVVGDWQASTRRIWLVNKKNDDIKVVTVRQISFLQLLGHAHNVREAKKTFHDNLRKTFLLTDEGRGIIKER